MIVLQGCGSSIQAGFSNTTGTNRQSRPRQQHDAIANGPEACAPNAEQPLPFDNPECRPRKEEAAQGGAPR
jgi:hypothetical protein